MARCQVAQKAPAVEEAGERILMRQGLEAGRMGPRLFELGR